MNDEHSLVSEEEGLETKLEETSLNSKSQSMMVTALRWIAVLPAAVAAFAVVQLLIILANSITTNGYADWFLQLANSFAGAYAFVFAGAHTAPKRQYMVGIVLAVLFSAFIIGLMVLRWFIKTSDPFWWLALAGVISLVALVAAVIQLKEDRWQLK
jgi:hypothetical protein